MTSTRARSRTSSLGPWDIPSNPNRNANHFWHSSTITQSVYGLHFIGALSNVSSIGYWDNNKKGLITDTVGCSFVLSSTSEFKIRFGERNGINRQRGSSSQMDINTNRDNNVPAVVFKCQCLLDSVFVWPANDRLNKAGLMERVMASFCSTGRGNLMLWEVLLNCLFLFQICCKFICSFLLTTMWIWK